MFIESKKDIHTVVELIESSNQKHLDSRGNIINEVVCLGDISEKMIAQSAITYDVKSIFDTLLTFKKNTPEIFIKKIDQNNINKTFTDLFFHYVEKNSKKILIGYLKYEKTDNSTKYLYFVNPKKDDKLYNLKKEDKIIFLGLKK